MTNLPQTYLEARRALAKAARIDEVKKIRDKSIAMEVYAHQAQDSELLGFATEMRKRAERRIGELMEEMRQAGLLAKGARERGTKRGTTRVSEKPASLADQGVEKGLADRARKAYAMEERQFEAFVAKTVALAVAAVQGSSEVIKEAKKERHEKKKAARRKREKELAGKQRDLPDKKYGVILADPEWRFEVWSEKGLTNTSADNHYSTSSLEVIKSRKVASIAADDCALFLWATVPMMPEALEVMNAWGFKYKSHVAWVKHKSGTGYWFRNRHELLLLGTRGKPPCPSEGEQWPSVLEASSGKHSEKPEESYRLIEDYFPNLPKIELNQRKGRVGWEGWGDEAPAEAAE